MKRDILNFLTDTVKNAYLEIKDIEKEVSLKGRKDVVTNCDLLVEKYIINEINKKYPDIDILSEEYNSNNEVNDTYFVIDPIDGTINFAYGMNIWAIQVAYVEKGTIIASCMYFPKLDELYTSLKDEGSYLNGKKIQINNYPGLENSLIAMSFGKEFDVFYDLFKDVAKKVLRVRDFGAGSFCMAMVACGKLDGYCVLADTKWDIEPGLIACSEAGAKVYRDEFCTIVANSDEIIDTILNSIQTII